MACGMWRVSRPFRNESDECTAQPARQSKPLQWAKQSKSRNQDESKIAADKQLLIGNGKCSTLARLINAMHWQSTGDQSELTLITLIVPQNLHSILVPANRIEILYYFCNNSIKFIIENIYLYTYAMELRLRLRRCLRLALIPN